MPFISDAQLSRVQQTMGSLATKANRAAEKAREKKDAAIRVGCIIGGAAASGYLRGYQEKKGKDFNIPGTTIDMEMAAGAGLVGAALMDAFGNKWDDRAIDVGAGMLAHYSGQVLRNYAKTGKIGWPLVAGHGAAGSLVGHNGGMSESLRNALSATP